MYNNGIFSYFNDIANLGTISNERTLFEEEVLGVEIEEYDQLMEFSKVNGLESACNVISNIIVREYNLNNNALNDINIQDIFGIPSLESVGLYYEEEAEIANEGIKDRYNALDDKLAAKEGDGKAKRALKAAGRGVKKIIDLIIKLGGLIAKGFRSIRKLTSTVYTKIKNKLFGTGEFTVEEYEVVGGVIGLFHSIQDQDPSAIRDSVIRDLSSSEDTSDKVSAVLKNVEDSKKTMKEGLKLKKINSSTIGEPEIKILRESFEAVELKQVDAVLEAYITAGESLKNAAKAEGIHPNNVKALNKIASVIAGMVSASRDKFSKLTKTFKGATKDEAVAAEGAEVNYDFNEIASMIFGMEGALNNGEFTSVYVDPYEGLEENEVDHILALESVTSVLNEMESTEALTRDIMLLDTLVALENAGVDIDNTEEVKGFMTSDNSLIATEGAKLDKFKEGAAKAGKAIADFFKRIWKFITDAVSGLGNRLQSLLKRAKKLLRIAEKDPNAKLPDVYDSLVTLDESTRHMLGLTQVIELIQNGDEFNWTTGTIPKVTEMIANHAAHVKVNKITRADVEGKNAAAIFNITIMSLEKAITGFNTAKKSAKSMVSKTSRDLMLSGVDSNMVKHVRSVGAYLMKRVSQLSREASKAAEKAIKSAEKVFKTGAQSAADAKTETPAEA